jgi:hypothetical protein
MSLVLPSCPALIVCRRVEVDPASGLPTLVDVQQELVVESFPSIVPNLVVWVELHDGLGAMELVPSVCRPADERAGALRLGEWCIPVEFTRPGQFRTVLFEARSLPLPGPGEVELRLTSGAAVIMRRTIPVGVRTPGVN